MYSVFRKHRKLKLLGLTLGLLLAWFLVKPAADMIQGQNAEESSLVGTYANTAEHQVTILEDGVGKMVSESLSESFFYSYQSGVLECRAIGFEFQIRVLGNGNLWNCYDSTYLYRRADI